MDTQEIMNNEVLYILDMDGFLIDSSHVAGKVIDRMIDFICNDNKVQEIFNFQKEKGIPENEIININYRPQKYSSIEFDKVSKEKVKDLKQRVLNYGPDQISK